MERLEDVLKQFVPSGYVLWSYNPDHCFEEYYTLYVMPFGYDVEVDIAEKILVSSDLVSNLCSIVHK